MALTLVTNPVGSKTVKLFAGFKPVEFVFKREDLAITDVESGSGGLRINITTDLTSYLSVGDAIYVYSEGAAYTYDAVGIILSLTATDITTDIAFVQVGTGGYINYKKNYFVELQCVDKNFASSNLLPFSLNSDGDSAGNINIDVSIVNDLNRQRGLIADGHISESRKEFEVQYREVYSGSSNSFTLIDNKLIVLLYATDNPETEEILNQFDIPKIYLGYPAALVIAKEADAASSKITMSYKELDINNIEITNGDLSELDSDVNGFIMWSWSKDASISEATSFLEFFSGVVAGFEFAATDFAYPDFLTE
jgi:hypothetical protein